MKFVPNRRNVLKSSFHLAPPLPDHDFVCLFVSCFALGTFVCRWPRPDEALVTFATPALARQAVSARNNRDSVLLVELLSQARVAKRTGYRRGKVNPDGVPDFWWESHGVSSSKRISREPPVCQKQNISMLCAADKRPVLFTRHTFEHRPRRLGYTR